MKWGNKKVNVVEKVRSKEGGGEAEWVKVFM